MVTRQQDVVREKTRVRRQFCSYYTESDPILSYMVDQLEITHDDMILEPCAGEGAFISKITDAFPEPNYTIEGLDIDAEAISKLKATFPQDNIRIREADTLLDETLDLYSGFNGFYSKIIGNPPYGAWQQYDKRKVLRKKYGGYVRETYSLFIRRAVDLLKPNGKLVYIVPDTFLALHVHKNTRELILRETTLDEIVLMPSKFFPGVNFGYANLCIITLRKAEPIASHRIRIIRVESKVENLYKIKDSAYSIADHYEEVAQNSIIQSIGYSFFLGASKDIRDLINSASITLGDVAHCVTGFCSGNNKKFYRKKSLHMRIGRDCNAIGEQDIDAEYHNKPDLLDGLDDASRYIPIVKGGKGIFSRETECYVLWDKETVKFYRTDKKARFQNSKFYFREGIGVPMVRSARLKAFLLERRIFDQSIVGIFPKNEDTLYYLLAFLNSDVCNRVIKVINHTANNSANYLKKLPIIFSEDHFQEISDIARRAVLEQNNTQTMTRLNELFDEVYRV